MFLRDTGKTEERQIQLMVEKMPAVALVTNERTVCVLCTRIISVEIFKSMLCKERSLHRSFALGSPLNLLSTSFCSGKLRFSPFARQRNDQPI